MDEFADLRDWSQNQGMMPNDLEQGVRDLLSAYDALAAALKKEQGNYASLSMITQETYDAIWAIAGDDNGSWDYPAQIVRFVEYLKQESDQHAKTAFELSGNLARCSAEAQALKQAAR